jgi:hypothetical protein
MVYEISMHEIPAQRIMSIRGSVPRGDVPDFIDRSFADLRSHLRLLGVRAVAGSFVILPGRGGVDRIERIHGCRPQP